MKTVELSRTDASLIAMRRILRAVDAYARDLVKASGLTPAQFRVLQIIAAHESTTPTPIAQQMHVTQATISNLLERLVAKGMVERQRSDADRRQMILTATALGRETVSEAPDALQQRYVKQFEALPDWEQAMLVAALERVAALLDAADLDASTVLASGDLWPSQNGF